MVQFIDSSVFSYRRYLFVALTFYRHGLAKTETYILGDPNFSFQKYCKPPEPTSQPNSPANFKLFGKDIGKVKGLLLSNNDVRIQIKSNRLCPLIPIFCLLYCMSKCWRIC